MSWIQFGKKYSSLKSQAFIGGLEMKCQKCGTENEAGVRFCKKCGHEMRLSMGVDPSGNTGNNSYAVSNSGSSYNGSEDNTPIFWISVVIQYSVCRNYSYINVFVWRYKKCKFAKLCKITVLLLDCNCCIITDINLSRWWISRYFDKKLLLSCINE